MKFQGDCIFIPTVVFTVATCLKVLLIPSYHSTDFEVHRNWLALTYSLPPTRWYYEDTSKWTLDYPPFFAWFEWTLSWLAAKADPNIVKIDNLEYGAPACVLFQRISIILSDLVLLYAVIQYCRWKQFERNIQSFVISVLVLLNTGLLLVDHIHFQYNGFLYGILLLSILKMLQQKHVQAAGWFALLLNLKHIYIYVAPAYFIYLLKHHCFSQPTSKPAGSAQHFSPMRFFQLAAVVLGIFTLSFGPFIYYLLVVEEVSFAMILLLGLTFSCLTSANCNGFDNMTITRSRNIVVFVNNLPDLPLMRAKSIHFAASKYKGQLLQVLSRLFPFKRGLCHAYWAPNFWAIYSGLDKLLAIIGFSKGESGSMTSGVVGEMQLQALPSVPPVVTVILTAIAIMPPVVKLWKKENTCGLDFLHCLILCGYASFMFGWHVHEKAIMMVTIPMCLLVMEDAGLWRIFTLLSTVAHMSLFPLLFNTAETLIKVCLFIPYLMIALTSSTLLKGSQPACLQLKSLDITYMGSCVLIQTYCLFLHGLGGFLSSLEFLPLLLTSVTCALGIIWAWFLTLTLYLRV